MSSPNENPLLCPTFSSYTCDRLVEIATKVSDDYKNIVGGENDDDLFEFSLSIQEFDSAVVHKSSIFPVFNREVSHSVMDQNTEKLDGNNSVRLNNLFTEKCENRISTSSSELESESESESETPGSYCVWRRKSTGSSPSSCKKSKSTGSVLFKRFNICDLLLRRSNSDGQNSYVFAAKIDKSTTRMIDCRKSPRHSVEVTGKAKMSPASSAHELFYIQNRSMKEGDKRKSYLPYRKDLIGFFSVLGRASRT